MKRAAPLWLAAPSRFAGLGKARARGVLVLLGLGLLLALTALVATGPAAVSSGGKTPDDQSDVILYESIVDGIRHGGDYYTVAASALRAGDYPLRPFVTFRLPGLAQLQAHMPRPIVFICLYLLAFCTFTAWAIRLREALSGWAPLAIGLALVAGGMMAFVQSDLWAFHEIWAGLLIALSLALRRPDRWLAAVAIGLIAMLIRETAALYALVMLGLAWRDGERREALGWAAALALFGVALAAHAFAVGAVTTPADPASPGWSGMHGPGFAAKALVLSTAVRLFPMAIAAPLVALALFGWAAWRDPLAVRVWATIALFGVLLALFARADTFYWALMIAPLALAGLVFVPDGLRDVAAQALDKRRITVTRVTR